MAKPEWGIKRICASCGARFYDLRRNPIICPKCETEFKVEQPAARRRSRPAPAEAKPPKKEEAAVAVKEEAAVAVKEEAAVAVEVTPVVDDDAEDDEIEEELAEIDDESDDDVIEDTSDLGEDDDDMAEVLEHTEADEKE